MDDHLVATREDAYDGLQQPRVGVKPEPQFSVWRAVIVERGTGPGSAIEATVKAMVGQGRGRDYEGLVLLGDLIYPEGDADEVASSITDIFAPLTSGGTRLVPVLGNHD